MQPGEVRELAVGLTLALREKVLPQLGSHAGREHSGAGEGGDVTFAIDEVAEAFMEEHLAQNAPAVAFYSEDRGLVTPGGEPEWVLIVDPIDGTRPAMAGLEAACVSVAAARLDSEPTMGDVQVGCVTEIKSGALFVAERGSGCEPAGRLSANTDLRRMFWAYGLRGRPVRAVAEVLAELLDGSSLGGGTFDLGSACFDMTRVVTGQLDAYIEPGPRMVADVPGMREAFERVGAGAVLNNSPYDVAAAALICEEAGAVVTDAYGVPLAARRLLGSGADFQISSVTAANAELHMAICAQIDAGIERLAARSIPPGDDAR
jgi:myo-inositol-1(or 4)-monophosphatase